MGNVQGTVPGKTDSPENQYLDKALQIKDNLDCLALFAQSLEQTLDSQNSTVTGIQAELRRLKSETSCSTENKDFATADQRQHPLTANTRVSIEDKERGFDGKYRSTDVDCPHNNTRYGDGTQQRGTSGGRKKSKTDRKPDETHGIHTNIQRSSSSVEHELTAGKPNHGKQGQQHYGSQDELNKASGLPGSAVRRENVLHSPMEVDQCNRETGGYNSNQSMSMALAESGIPHFLEALMKNQDSAMLQAAGIFNTIQSLQERVTKEIPPEERQRHGSSVNPEKFVFQVKLHSGQPSRSVSSELSVEQGAQTDMDIKSMEQLLEENRNIKSLNESNERLLKNRKAEIERLKRDLTNARDRSSSSQPQSSGWNSWRSPPKPPRGKASVQIYCSRRSDKINAVNTELDTMLKTHFDSFGYDLTCTSCDKREQLNTGIPVIVLCINASRLGTDVQTSLEGTTGIPRLAVVILHHKDTHALPKQPSRRVLTGTEYKSLGLIDMAFLANRGVYPCDMNQNALSELVNFIMSKA